MKSILKNSDKFDMRTRYLFAGILISIYCSFFSVGCGRKPEVMTLNEFAGAPARAVWVRQVEGNGTDPLCRGDQLVLMGMDGAEGEVERQILPDVGNYRKPLITPDGNGIIFTRFTEYDFYYVNWDGSGLRKLGHGHAAEVWQDPDTGLSWVYYIAGEPKGTVDSGKPIKRCRLDDPEIQEIIWEKTSAGPDNLQLSADGTIMAGLFPWPLGGVVDIPNQTLQKVGTGCWTSISPDNQYLVWVFDGPHKGILLRSLDGSVNNKIRLNSAPRSFRHEVYHPRWSNHPKLFSMTGPYRQKGQYNNITGGGKDINIYVGQFDESYKKVDRWFQLTKHRDADFYPDVWVQGAQELSLSFPVGSKGMVSDSNAWPTDKRGLKFVWSQANRANAVDDPEHGYYSCKLTRKGKARLSRFFEMDVSRGSYFSDEMGSILSSAISESLEFTVFLTFMSRELDVEQQSVLMALGLSEDDLNMAFIQTGDELELLVAGDTYALGNIETEKHHNVCLSYSRKTGLRFYKQGSMIRNESKVRLPSLKSWAEAPLSFGAWRSGAGDWPGTLEGIAWYDRVLDQDEIGQEYTVWIGAQPLDRFKSVNRVILDAKLTQKSPMPTAEGIAPYRSSLVEYLYDVERIVEGEIDDHQVIVQHWAILDASVYPLNREEGKTYRLILESVDDHPELEGERISSELIDPVGIYLDVGWE
ncbi:hypothetical protein P4B35_22310 [Pontiellaceae bacterium B12227]|nr:hypothetical protein [Pontiellaceae bacterium B12227]